MRGQLARGQLVRGPLTGGSPLAGLLMGGSLMEGSLGAGRSRSAGLMAGLLAGLVAASSEPARPARNDPVSATTASNVARTASSENQIAAIRPRPSEIP